MFPIFAFLFIAVPIVDIWLLFSVGGQIGPILTAVLCISTGIGGAALARWQGFQTLARIQTDLSQGQMPGKVLGEGALILVAAAVLMTPGFITDALGLSLLIPPLRRLWLKVLTHYFRNRVQVHTTQFGGGFGAAPGAGFGQTQVHSHQFDDSPFGPPSSGPKYVRNEAMERETRATVPDDADDQRSD